MIYSFWHVFGANKTCNTTYSIDLYVHVCNALIFVVVAYAVVLADDNGEDMAVLGDGNEDIDDDGGGGDNDVIAAAVVDDIKYLRDV